MEITPRNRRAAVLFMPVLLLTAGIVGRLTSAPIITAPTAAAVSDGQKQNALATLDELSARANKQGGYVRVSTVDLYLIRRQMERCR